MVRLIGDIHGKIESYSEIIAGCDESVQLGDFGFGFVKIPTFGPKHRFIRGNHDDPGLVSQNPRWICDGTIRNGVLYVGGAYSIDRDRRIPGISWWYDEEIPWDTCNHLIDISHSLKGYVHTIISHDCPQNICMEMFGYYKSMGTKTGLTLNLLWENIEPKNWYFGHHHQDVEKTINNTKFRCLGELSYIDVDFS